MRSRIPLSTGHVAAIPHRAGRATRRARPLALGLIALCSALSPAGAQLPVYSHPETGFFQPPRAFLAPTGDPVEGVLQFMTQPSPNADQIDFQAFATCDTLVEHSPVVISSRLTIQPPVTPFPMLFSTRATIQSGTGIQPRWALLMNPPGTTYVLEVVTECTLNGNGSITKQRHIDRYPYLVGATVDSLRAVIKVFSVHPSGTVPSLPLIVSHQTSLDLLAGVDTLEAEIADGDTAGARSAIDAMTALVQQAAAAGKIASDRSHPAAAILILDLQYIRASL